MIEPEVTAVLGRRLLAFLLDSSLVAATGLGTAYFTSTAFPVVGQDGAGKALVDPVEFETMRELLNFELLGRSEILGLEIVRAQEIGDSVRVFGGASYMWGLIAAAIAAVILFGLVPMLLKRTIGMLPFGLGIKRTDGTKAGPGAHLVRTLVGFIDAIPFVIPGLLGFAKAKGSPHRQRIGDLAAKTVVVDLKSLALSEAPREKIDLGLKAPDDDGLSAPTPPAAPVVPAGPTPEDLASTGTPNDAPPAWTSPLGSLDSDTAPSSTAPSGAVPTAADAPTTADVPPRTVVDSTRPPVAKPTLGDPLPPPPVHRKSPGEHPLGTPSSRGVDDAAATTDDSFQPASEVDAPTASAADHLAAQQLLPQDLAAPAADQAEIPDETWEPPREELAPVWQPATLETAPVESPNPHDGRTLDDVERIEPSIGALLANDADDHDTPAEPPSADASSTTPSDNSRPGKHSQSESSAKAPVWSDKWRAWMYWDPKKKCWLRHDAASNTWEPVD